MLRDVVLLSCLLLARAQSPSNGYSTSRDGNVYDYSNSVVSGRYTTDGSSVGGGGPYYSFGAGGGVGGGGGGGGSSSGTAQRYTFEDSYESSANAYNQFSASSPTESYAGHSAGNNAGLTDSNIYSASSHGAPSYDGKTVTSFDGYSASKQTAGPGNVATQFAASGEYASGNLDAGHAAETTNFADYAGNANGPTAASLGYSGTETGHSTSYSPVAGHASSFSPSSYATSQLGDDFSFGKYRGKYTAETSGKYANNGFAAVPEMHYVRGHRGTAYPGVRGSSPSYVQETASPAYGKIRYGLDKPSKYPGHEYSTSHGLSSSNYLSREPSAYVKGGGKTFVIKGSRPGYYSLYPAPGGAVGSSIRALMAGGGYKGKGGLLYRTGAGPAGAGGAVGYSAGPAASFAGSYGQGADHYALRYDSAGAHGNTRLESVFA